MPNNETNQLITTAKLGRFKNKLPAWTGTRAQHTAAEQAGTLPTNGIIGISDEEGSGGGGGGGDARSKIFKNVTVYKSSDFERISDGTNTYPCVHFQGKSSGKIVMIKILCESSMAFARNNFIYLKHFGGNLLDVELYNASNTLQKSFTTDGLTFSYLPGGGISVIGTATANMSIRIGTLAANYNFAGTLRCCGLTGTYDGLRLYFVNGSSHNTSYYNNGCPIDEEAECSTINVGSSNPLRLLIPKDTVVDCTFYPQVCTKWSTNKKYETPFNPNNLGFLDQAQTVPYSAYNNPTNDSSTMSARYLNGDTARARYKYSIDYPVVHTGENTFMCNLTAIAYQFEFEIYYTEDNINRADLGGYIPDLDTEYEYAKDLIFNYKHLLPILQGSTIQPVYSSYLLISQFRAQSSVLPTKIYCAYSVVETNNSYQLNALASRDIRTNYGRYVLDRENFIFDTAEASYGTYLHVPVGSLSKDSTYHYVLLCDYSGFDDSTTIT